MRPTLCHMFFGNGLGEPFFGALATHPPMADRIRAIDPTLGRQISARSPTTGRNRQARRTISRTEHARPPMPNIFGSDAGRHHSSPRATPEHRRSSDPHSVLPNLGNPTPLHLKYAEQLRDSLPENVKAAAREPLDATALIYALLLSADETNCATQLAGNRQAR